MTAERQERERSDSSALCRLQQNPQDEAAWRRFIDLTSPPLLRYLLRFTRNIDTARDILQDVLMRFVEKRMFVDVKDADAALALLRRMAKNRFIDWLRKARARAGRTVPFHEDSVQAESDSSEPGESAEIIGSEVEKLASHLSETEQQLLAFALDEEDLTAIARKLEVPYSTAAVRIFRLREKLRHLTVNDPDILKL